MIIPLHKSKGERGECGNRREINLLRFARKLYCLIVVERVKKRTEDMAGEEQDHKNGRCV